MKQTFKEPVLMVGFGPPGCCSSAWSFQQGRLPGGLWPATLRALLSARQRGIFRFGGSVRGAGQLPQAEALLHHVPLCPRAPLWLARLSDHRRRRRRQHEAQPHHPELHGAVLPQRLLQAAAHEDFQLHVQLQEELLRLQTALTDSRLRPTGHRGPRHGGDPVWDLRSWRSHWWSLNGRSSRRTDGDSRRIDGRSSGHNWRDDDARRNGHGGAKRYRRRYWRWDGRSLRNPNYSWQ